MPLTLAELEALDRRMPNGPWRLTDALQVEASDGRLVASEVDVINCKVDDLSALRSVLPAYIERLRSDKRWMEFVARMQMNCQKSLDECAEEMQEAAERHGVTLPGPKSSRVDVSVNLSNGENATDVEAAIGKNFSAYRCGEPLPLGEKVGVVDFNKMPVVTVNIESAAGAEAQEAANRAFRGEDLPLPLTAEQRAIEALDNYVRSLTYRVENLEGALGVVKKPDGET